MAARAVGKRAFGHLMGDHHSISALPAAARAATIDWIETSSSSNRSRPPESGRSPRLIASVLQQQNIISCVWFRVVDDRPERQRRDQRPASGISKVI